MEDKEKAAFDLGLVLGMVIVASLCHFVFPSADESKQKTELKKVAQEQTVATGDTVHQQEVNGDKVTDEAEKKKQAELLSSEKKHQEKDVRAANRQYQLENWKFKKDR